MHATQPQGDPCPESHTAPDYSFVSGKPDIKAMTQQEFYHWATGTPNAPALPTLGCADGYVVTESGLKALIDTATGEAPGTAARVLRSAALYLERHGWIQGTYYDATSGSFTPPSCLVGAIGMACYGGPVDAPAQHFDDPGFLDFEEAVLHLDRWLLVEDGSESYEFNDAKGRQLADVLHVLRQAADTPADELVDAIRAIDAHNAEMAVLVDLLKPCGIWGETPEPPKRVAHVDYPHHPGTLYDCPACEAACYCSDDLVCCVRCAGTAEEFGVDSDGGDVE